MQESFIEAWHKLVHENCGVLGVFSLDGHNVIPLVIDSLRALQHRGQESWGLAIPGKPPLKRLGLVSKLFLRLSIYNKEVCFSRSIGHVRYSDLR